MHTGKLVGLALSALLVTSAPALWADEASVADAAFSRLSTLAGNWKRTGTDGSRFHIEFELTANDTVLVERWVNGGKAHSLTVYHIDGESLMATHYCPQGNQPRLKMASGEENGLISFDFYDATNLPSMDRSHQHQLSFNFLPEGQIIRGETYRQGTSDSKTEMALERIP